MTGALWHPTLAQVARAQVTQLAARLGLPDFDALRAHSVADPAAYWRGALEFLGIVWDRPPQAYADFSRGREFPRWFPGGRLNWVDTVMAHAATAPDRKAVVTEHEDGRTETLTYAELAVQVRRFAAGLRAQGIGPGDRVGLLCDNGVEATVSILALARIGAIAVPLFSGFGAEAVISRLEPAAACALIATTGFTRRGRYIDMQPVVQQALAALPGITTLIWKCAPGVPLPGTGLDWSTLAATPDDGAPARPMDPMDPFLLIYTSGTTGRPKGPVHTHGGFPLKIAHDAAVHFDVGPGDVFCWPADMGWIAGTLVLGCALLRGATLLLYNGAPDFPDWSRMAQLCATHRVTQFGSAPTLIRGLAANEGAALGPDRTSVRLLITAGEVIDADHFTWFRTRFGTNNAPLINYTGGTEVSGALLASVPVRPIAPGGFNTASPGVDVAVTDANGHDLTGTVGELVIRAPFVGMTASFWQDDARYLDSYWSAIPGLWVHGDLAVQDETGAFVMMGRSDDTLKVAGKRLGPAEVEAAALELPGVSECAAVGIEDAMKGQKLVVLAVAAPDCAHPQALPATIADAVAERLGKPFRPARVHLIAQLPKTRSGKIMRRLIRQVYAGQAPGDLSSLDNPAALDLIRALAAPA